MAPHSSTLAWKIPWTEEPGRLQTMGSGRVGHDWATSLSLFPFMHWRRKWQPTPVFLPGESQGRGAWWAAVYGVAQSRTWLKRLSSSITFLIWQKHSLQNRDLRVTQILSYFIAKYPSRHNKTILYAKHANCNALTNLTICVKANKPSWSVKQITSAIRLKVQIMLCVSR